jgi:hypothetical protein
MTYDAISSSVWDVQPPPAPDKRRYGLHLEQLPRWASTAIAGVAALAQITPIGTPEDPPQLAEDDPERLIPLREHLAFNREIAENIIDALRTFPDAHNAVRERLVAMYDASLARDAKAKKT